MHSVYMSQAAQGGAGPYAAMPGTGTLGSSAAAGRGEPRAVAPTSALYTQIPAW